MPTIEEHEEKFKHNSAFIDKINGFGYDDWQITACFYAALHIIKSRLHSEMNIEDWQMANHIDTKNVIRKKFNNVSIDYAALLSLSYTARYGASGEILSMDLNDAKTLLQNIVDNCNSLKQKNNTPIHQ